MEQTVNTFQKGLQTDIHPMVQGNDVLSDALNATFVTMNGNEIILQNDMGNRRIDDAYLPPGYEPVGIKEYGGVIYIAAYNPITNQSQLGSFPSPERKLSPADFKNGGDDLSGSLDFSTSFVNENMLKTDSVLIPLTKKDSLHAGDKFVVYCGSLSKDNITNYDNITRTGKIASPKNKSYTLALGILNSQNEFVDITKSLVRWDTTNNTIMNLDDKSDLYKFNAGYFIASNKPNGCKTQYTIRDRELIEERLAMPANTYAYKLVGPLYLKATLNRIQEFNYNIYGSVTSKSGDSITGCEIVIEGFITYNCPDIQTPTKSNNSGGEYNDYYETLISELGWTYTFNPGESSYITTDSGSIVIKPSSSERSVYNPETNTYSAKVVKEYNIGSDKISNNKLKYALGVIANYENKYIVESLSTKGEIDLTKLGSGTIDLIGWRFYNQNKTTKLTYIFEAYPEYGCEFKNLKFTFHDVAKGDNNNDDIIIENLPIYNGRNTIEIDWEKEGIEERKLYEVTINVDKYNNITSSKETDFSFTRWILSTSLMNDCYNQLNANFIKDYGNPVDNEVKILKHKLKVQIKPNLNLVDNSYPEYSKVPKDLQNLSENGKWFKQYSNAEQLPDIGVKYEHKYHINLSINPTLEIVNDYLYPDFIESVTTNINNITTTATIDKKYNQPNINFTGNYGDNQSPKLIKNEDYKLVSNLQSNEDIGLTNQSNIITKDLNIIDEFISSGSKEGVIKYPFGDAIKYFCKSISQMEIPDNETKACIPMYVGIGVTWDSRGGGHRDIKYLNVFTSRRVDDVGTPSQVSMSYGDDDAYSDVDNTYKIRYQISYTNSNSSVHLPEKNYPEQIIQIKDIFASLPSTSVITYLYHTDSNSMIASPTDEKGNTYLDINSNARVYWREKSGSWALFDTLLNRTTGTYNLGNEDRNLYNFIKNNIFGGKNIIYCFSDQISFADIKMAHVSDNDLSKIKYNQEYSIELPIIIKTTFNEGSYTLSSIEPYVQCKNRADNTAKIQFSEIDSNSGDNPESVIEHHVTIKSSEDFQSIVRKMLGGDFKNMEISTGQDRDNKGNLLSSRNFYIINDNGELSYKEMPGLVISPEFGNENYNTILYEGNTEGQFTLNYDMSGWEDRDGCVTVNYYELKFDKVII